MITYYPKFKKIKPRHGFFESMIPRTEGEQISMFPEEKLTGEQLAVKKAKKLVAEGDDVSEMLQWMDDKDLNNPLVIKFILKLKNIPYTSVKTISGDINIIYDDNDTKMIISVGNDRAYDLKEFISESISSGNIEELVPEDRKYLLELETQFNNEFWESPSSVYHGTDEDNIPDIKKEGLIASSNTRGMSNRSVGSAVFASFNAETSEYHYGKLLVINTPKMKKDGYTPFVYQEPDIAEKSLAEAIANMYGIDDYYYDVEGGMDEDTIIFDGNIPAKYLSLTDK